MDPSFPTQHQVMPFLTAWTMYRSLHFKKNRSRLAQEKINVAQEVHRGKSTIQSHECIRTQQSILAESSTFHTKKHTHVIRIRCCCSYHSAVLSGLCY